MFEAIVKTVLIVLINHCVERVQMQSYFWSAFFCIQSEYKKIRPRNNFVFGHFSHNKLNGKLNHDTKAFKKYDNAIQND